MRVRIERSSWFLSSHWNSESCSLHAGCTPQLAGKHQDPIGTLGSNQITGPMFFFCGWSLRQGRWRRSTPAEF